MPYQKTVYDNRAIADISRAAVDNIEGALDVGYHAVSVHNCTQHVMIYERLLLAQCAFWPFFEGRLNTVQDFGMNGYHMYVNTLDDLEAWDVPPEDIGVMRSYVFNGTDEYLIADDQDLFTVTATNEFTLGAWINLKVTADNAILSKWDATTDSELREWLFCTDNTGYLSMIIYDETNNAEIGREYQTALPTSIWQHVVATYDGGTDAANIKVYLNGVQVDDANIADDVGFASMVNTATDVRCGSYEGADGEETYPFDGKMWGPFFTLTELSAVEVWKLYQLGKAALNLDLIAGMPD